MKEHKLKVLPEFWDDLASGKKTFEVRFDGDRGFAVGDTLRLREWDGSIPTPVGEKWNTEVGYTGREIRRTITYLLRGEKWGIAREYVVLAIV